MSEKTERVIFLADCQSFYASVEKAAHPEYRDKPVVVAGDPERRSGIILAACPIAKSFGIGTAERLGESLQKCPDLIVVRPRMQRYIEVSLLITQIYKRYTELVEPFSIDEQFLDITGSQQIFGSPMTLALAIQKDVLMETGVWIRIGTSTNKILAKIATDIFAKKNQSGIFTLHPTEIDEVLWPQPVHKMFGVGNRMHAHFYRLGIHTIGDVAKTPLSVLKQKFRALFGKQSDIQAEVMWRTANGLDDSPVTPGTFGRVPKSVGHMMTLPRDYGTEREINTILLELSEEVCRDSRRKGYMGSVVNVSCMCSPYEAATGFSRQQKMLDPTNHADDLYKAAKDLFYRHWNRLPVRRVGLTLSSLVEDAGFQLTLFDDRIRARNLDKATDQIKQRYGRAAIMRASSILSHGQAIDRAGKIGGHYK